MVFRMMMPISAIMPSMATNPNGSRNASKPIATPTTPNGAVINTIAASEKLCNCSISNASHTNSINGAPALIDACAELLGQRSDCVMSTVAHAIHDLSDYVNPNVVKVVLDAQSRALLFSRAPLPWWRDGSARGVAALPQDPPALRHVGLYAYRAGFLRRFPTLAMAPLERTEALEQLRVLWHGERIAVHVTSQAPGPGVDTLEDLQRVRLLYAQPR
mgnify:CR=1 FL=1